MTTFGLDHGAHHGAGCWEVLGVAAPELPGSHSPYLSRAAALAALLDEVAGRMTGTLDAEAP